MKQAESSARDVAVWALRDRAGNVSARLEHLLDRSALARPDADLARELALGVVRRRQTLRAITAAFLTKPGKKLPAPIEEVLLVALYQMLFLDRVPAYAAVDEAVSQAVRFAHRRQSGLVNGLLRAVSRQISELHAGLPPLQPDIVPVGPGSYRRLSRAVFADPCSHPAEFLAGAYSLPVDLAGRWLARLGSPEKAAELATHANTRAPVILRVNRLRASVTDVLDALSAEGCEAFPHENGFSVVLSRQQGVTKLGAFVNGWVQPQDPTASAVCIAAEPKPGTAALDFCASPGTKTTHLAELMDNRGSITAVDVSQEKTDRIESSCRRMGISIVTTRLADQVGGLAAHSFDLALVDVPCSNTGVLSRRAEARWRLDLKELGKLVQDQITLVEMAAQFVRPGGRLVYSTCSIEPEECDQIAARLRQRRGGLKLIRQELILPAGAQAPARWHDGGYFAIFEVN